MKNRLFLHITAVSLVILITSCNFPITCQCELVKPTLDIIDTIPLEVLEIQITKTPTPLPTPICPDVSSFGKIYDHWPSDFKLVDTSPNFTWFYTSNSIDPNSSLIWSEVCVPESYTFYFSTGPDFEDEIVVNVTNPSVVPDPTKLNLNWTLPIALEPMKVYRWITIGHYQGIELEGWKIPDMHNDEIWPPINNVNMSYKRCVFRTGPECTVGNIDVPLLTNPNYGDVLDTLNPTLEWSLDSCMPLVFSLEISTSAAFENPQNSVDPSLPGDYTKITQRNYNYAYIEYTLRDCTQYFWRVKGGIGYAYPGDPLPRQYGAFSDTGMFYVNTGHCPTPTPTPIPPTKTPTPTLSPSSTPSSIAFSCIGLSQTDCENYPNQCKWIPPVFTHPSTGYCVSR